MFLRICFLVFSLVAFHCLSAQNAFRYSCTKDTTVAPCGQGCATLRAIIPDIHGQSNTYTITKLSGLNASGQPEGCFAPYVTPNNNVGNPTELSVDDSYGPVVDLGFTFTFFGSNYTKFVAGTNGVVTFDQSLANLTFRQWQITNGGVPVDLPSSFYEMKGVIMGAYHDMQPVPSSSPTAKIQYQVIGTTPHRKWILSFYKQPLFNCNSLIQNTQQIVLYEGTGMVEVFIYDKQVCNSWNQGRAMIGMMDDSRTIGVMAPGRKASDAPWGSIGMNETWRFVPNTGIRLLKRIELVNLATNTVVQTLPASAAVDQSNGTLLVSFPNVCAPVGTTQFLVRPVYQRMDKQIFMSNPALTGPLYETNGADTIRINRAAGSLSATATATPAACITGGTVTVNVNPAGNYEFRIDGGPWQTSNVFNNVLAGQHTVQAAESGGYCITSVTVNVTPANPLDASTTNGTTACPGTATGSVTVNALSGTAPFEYRLGTGAWQTSNVFTGLAVGTYQFYTKDANGCTSNPTPGSVTDGAGPTATAAATATSCQGATDGSVTVTATSGGGPFDYSMSASGPWQTSNIFTGLASGSYNFYIRAGSCVSPAAPATVNPGSQITASASATNTSCQGAVDGSVTITATSGTGPFQYATSATGPWQAGATFSGLAANSYNFYMKNAAGCITAAIPATVNAGPALQVAATGSPTSCAGANDGSVTVSNPNGTGPFEYRMGATGSWQTSPTFSGLATGSYDFYTRNAAGCVSPAVQGTVTAGSVLQASVTTTNTSCPGANNGSAEITALSGSGPYEYRMGATGVWQTSNIFSGLPQGSYTFYAKAPSGCISNGIPGNISDGPAVTAQPTATATSCAGATDGSVTVTAPTGTGPFQYSMNAAGPWQSSGVFSGLAQGSYTFYARNADCISAGVQATVAPGAALQASATPTATSCAGATDGSVVVNNTNGTGPFEYSMNAAGPWQLSNTFNGLAQGSYTFYIKNASCVSSGVQATVDAGTVLQASATPTATSCLGASNGSVQVNALSGSGPYEYRMGATGTWQTSNTFTGLAYGNYVFYAKAASGCISNAINAFVDNGPALTAQPTATATSCDGATDGSVTVTAPGGTGPFEYRLGATGIWQSSNTFTNLASGNYVFYVKNADCISAGANATVNAGPQLVANTAVTSTSCQGASDGSVVVSAANGTGPFEYRMGATGIWQTSGSFTSLSTGPYDFFVKNAAGCVSAAKQATVTAGSVLQASATASPTSCSGASNGSVQVNALSGNPPYEYRMGATGSWQTSNLFSGLAPGSYTFYAKSGNCISNGVPATVDAGSVLTATFSKTDVSCFGGSNGTATIIPPGMAMAYTYSKDNFATQQTSDVFTNLIAGNHTFWLKDNAGCIGTVNVVIGQPAQLAAPTPVVVSPKCNGGSDGSITVSPTGGTAPYQYSLNGSAYGNSNSLSVAAGNHSVRVRDANGCILVISNINVSQPAALSLNVLSTLNATCNGGANGEIQLAASGGTSPFMYAITGYSLQSSPVFKVNPGSYTVSVTDNNNCTYTRPAPVTIGLTNDMAYTPMTDTVICEGTGATLQPQTNATQFVWKGPAITPNNTAQSSISVKPVADTFYSVVATYGRCSYNDTVNVDVNTAPVADAGPGNTICFGKSDTLSASGGVTYEWSPLTYLSGNITGPDPVVNAPQQTITYSLYVRDAAGCRSLMSSTVTINVTPPLLVIVSPADTIGYKGDSIKIKVNSIGTSYTWSPSVGLSNPNVDNPTVFVTTDRIYTVTVSTLAGCSGVGIFRLRAYKGPDIYVPTAFTPNGDGLNDRVRPFSVGIEKLNYFRVFDRWGQLMYEYKGEKRGPVVYSMLESSIGWDGSFRGQELNTGTFVWLAEGVTKEGKIVFKKGTITLIR
jgi:gliding motility-associated-like protein